MCFQQRSDIEKLFSEAFLRTFICQPEMGIVIIRKFVVRSRIFSFIMRRDILRIDQLMHVCLYRLVGRRSILSVNTTISLGGLTCLWSFRTTLIFVVGFQTKVVFLRRPLHSHNWPGNLIWRSCFVSKQHQYPNLYSLTTLFEWQQIYRTRLCQWWCYVESSDNSR